MEINSVFRKIMKVITALNTTLSWNLKNIEESEKRGRVWGKKIKISRFSNGKSGTVILTPHELWLDESPRI